MILEAKSYPKAPVAKPPAPKRVLTTEVRPREQALLAARRGTLANACAGGGGAWEASLRCVQELFRIPPITSSFPSDDYQDFALQRLKIDFFNVPMHVIRQTFGECHCACRHRHARRVEGERYTHTHTRHGVVLRCQKRRHAPCRRLTPSSEPRRSRNASPPPPGANVHAGRYAPTWKRLCDYRENGQRLLKTGRPPLPAVRNAVLSSWVRPSPHGLNAVGEPRPAGPVTS